MSSNPEPKDWTVSDALRHLYCDSCHWWQRKAVDTYTSTSTHTGVCRRYAPRPEWPVTNYNDTCGELKPKRVLKVAT